MRDCSTTLLALIGLLTLSITAGAQVDGEPQPQLIDVSKLYSSIKAARLHETSDEEKTLELERRIEQFRFNALRVTDNAMATFRPSEHPRECEPSFNADKETYSIRCNFALAGSSSRGGALPISIAGNAKSQYLAANAFNRKVVVQRTDTIRYTLLLTPPDGKYLERRLTLYVDDIPSSRGNLKKDYSQLRFGIAFRLVPPFVDTDVTRTRPTIDSPYETSITDRFLVVAPLKAYRYDRGARNPSQVYLVEEKPAGPSTINLDFEAAPPRPTEVK